MKKILIPIDGSIASQKAAKKAVEVGNLLNAELTFITVVNLPTEEKYQYFGMSVEQAFVANRKEMLKELIQEENRMLNILVEKLDCKNLITVKKVVVGKAADEILKIATDEKSDLIIMGRRGLSNVERIFIGSITQKVISAAPCPVMVING